MRLLRPSLLYGKHGRLGVGRTKFFEDYVHRNDGAVEQFIAGTSVRRLKLVKIGQRAVAAISDEVDQLIEALRAERDARPCRLITARKTSYRLLSFRSPTAPGSHGPRGWHPYFARALQTLLKLRLGFFQGRHPARSCHRTADG